MSVGRWLDGKIFLPYKNHGKPIVSIRRSICGCHEAMAYYLYGVCNGYKIAILHEYYADSVYALEHEAKAALDEILIRNGAKLLTCEEDADKYRILI